VKISTEPLGSLGSEASLLAEPSIKEIMRGTTNPGISYQLRCIYSIYRGRCNVAACKWKDHNGKIEIISFSVVEFHSLSISRCRPRCEADPAK